MALVRGEAVLAASATAERRGQSERLAAMADSVLRAAGCGPERLDAVAVTTGPGSFTGLRAALSLAEGISRAAGRPLHGAGAGEVIAAEWRDRASERALWVAIDSRPGRVFLWRGGDLTACRLDALPLPDGPVALAGDAAEAVAARLAKLGADVMPTSIRRPSVVVLARLVAARLAAGVPPAPAAPLYVDPPEARRAAGGRPPPRETLVAATPAHAAALAAVHAQAFPAGQQWDGAAFAGLLAAPGTFGWIDPEGGLILARMAADEVEILTLAVAPAARRHGRGRALVAAALARAARQGAVVAFLEVDAANGPARALYESLGFVPVGRRPDYYAGGGEAIVLRAGLGARGEGR